MHFCQFQALIEYFPKSTLVILNTLKYVQRKKRRKMATYPSRVSKYVCRAVGTRGQGGASKHVLSKDLIPEGSFCYQIQQLLDSFYANFTKICPYFNTTFQKIPIPHLTRTYYETEIPSLTTVSIFGYFCPKL